MSLNRFAARRDANEPGIVDALRKCGAQVQIQDFPDLLVRFRGRYFLLEVTNPENKYRKRSQSQRDFMAAWGIPEVRTAEEALRAVEAA